MRIRPFFEATLWMMAWGAYSATPPRHPSHPTGPGCLGATIGCFLTPVERRADQRKKATDCDCPPYPATQSLPVGLANGGATLAVEDLRVPSRGFDFVWKRTYSSLADFKGAQGHNWSCTYERRVVLLVSGGGGLPSASVIDGLGREDTYGPVNGTVFEAPVGLFEPLVRNPGGDFTQTMPDGMRYGYDKKGRLVSVSDRNNNTLTVNRNASGEIASIVDTQDRVYTFVYAGGRLISITDFAGRQVIYTYDNRGDLIKVRSPVVTGMTQPENNFPNGKTTLYTYTSGSNDQRLNHNLISVFDPAYNVNDDPLQSKPWVVLSYSPETDREQAEYDRVVAQRWGHDQGGPSGNPNIVVGGTTTLAYTEDLTGDAQAPPNAFSLTTETDRNGNVTLHYFDEALQELKTIEKTNRDVRPGEGPYVTRYAYHPEGQVAHGDLHKISSEEMLRIGS